MYRCSVCILTILLNSLRTHFEKSYCNIFVKIRRSHFHPIFVFNRYSNYWNNNKNVCYNLLIKIFYKHLVHVSINIDGTVFELTIFFVHILYYIQIHWLSIMTYPVYVTSTRHRTRGVCICTQTTCRWHAISLVHQSVLVHKL